VHTKRLTEPGQSTFCSSVFNDFSIFTSPNSTAILNPAKQNTDTDIRQTNYYPFGLTHRGYNNLTTSLGSAGAKKYQYNGKELQEDFGLDWYDYGARFYDAGLGRWFVADPLVEDNHFEWTPYSYVYNNPISLTDFFGLDSIDAVALKEATENSVKKVTKKYGTKSAQCNRGVNYAYKELTGSDEFDGMDANQMIDHMENSDNFVKIKHEDAQNFQNDGKIVVAGNKEEGNGKHGHVVMGVPGKEEKSGSWNEKVPQVMNTGYGKREAKEKISFSWKSAVKNKVSYYLYKGYTYTSRTYSGKTLSTVTIKAKGNLTIKPKTIILNTNVQNSY
jgi:RHS repeat-associated protein